MPSPTFVAVSSRVTVPGTGGGSTTVDCPAGVVDDDIVLLVYVKLNNATPASLSSADFGAQVVGFDNSTFDLSYGIHMLRASSEPSTYTISETANTSGGFAFTVAYRGVPNTASPIYEDIQTYLAPSATTSPIPLPTATATSSTSILVGFALEFKTATVTFTPGGSLVERYDNNVSTRSFALFDEAISSAGSISGRTITPSGSARCRTVSIVLPGTAGGGGGGGVPIKAFRIIHG